MRSKAIPVHRLLWFCQHVVTRRPLHYSAIKCSQCSQYLQNIWLYYPTPTCWYRMSTQYIVHFQHVMTRKPFHYSTIKCSQNLPNIWLYFLTSTSWYRISTQYQIYIFRKTHLFVNFSRISKCKLFHIWYPAPTCASWVSGFLLFCSLFE